MYNSKNKKILKSLFILMAALSSIAWLDPYKDEVSRGNSRFHEKKYKEAGKHYKNAGKYAPGEKEKKKLSFNKGDSQYMSENYESAISNYRKSIQSEDREVQKKAFFNLGNTYMKMKKYREAVDSFVNALKIDPDYERAKKNIEYILQNKKDKQDKDKNKKKNKDNKDSKDKKNKSDENKKNDRDKQNNKQKKNSKTAGKMNREQIKNILKSMKEKPVRRKKGNREGRRSLEKYW